MSFVFQENLVYPHMMSEEKKSWTDFFFHLNFTEQGQRLTTWFMHFLLNQNQCDLLDWPIDTSCLIFFVHFLKWHMQPYKVWKKRWANMFMPETKKKKSRFIWRFFFCWKVWFEHLSGPWPIHVEIVFDQKMNQKDEYRFERLYIVRTNWERKLLFFLVLKVSKFEFCFSILNFRFLLWMNLWIWNQVCDFFFNVSFEWIDKKKIEP